MVFHVSLRLLNNRRPIAIFLNAARLNYDGKLNLSPLTSIANFISNEVDGIKKVEDIISLVSKTEADIVILKEMELPSKAVENFPSSVRLICEAGTGYNNIPLDIAKKQGILVCNIPTYSNESVAHMVITYILSFSAAMFDQARMLHNNDRRNFYTAFQHPIYEVTGKTLGMIGGSGTIGKAVADVAIPLGMNILISSRAGKLPQGHKYENHPNVHVVPFDDVFRQSDFVSINCPLNSETRHSIGQREIRMMKPTAFLINTARGAIINEKQLIQCMKDGVIAGAGLDTQEIEPPAENSELWNLSNVFMTPHIGWRRLETRQRLIDMTAKNIDAFIQKNPINIVNK